MLILYNQKLYILVKILLLQIQFYYYYFLRADTIITRKPKKKRKKKKKKKSILTSSYFKVYFYHILPWFYYYYSMIQLVSKHQLSRIHTRVLLLLECTAQCANSINRLNEPELSWNASWLSSFNVYNSAFEHVGCQKGNKQMWEIHQVHP